MAGERPRRRPLGPRSAVLLALLASGAWACWFLGLSISDLVPNRGGASALGDFAARALSPALESELHGAPSGTPPLLLRALVAAAGTVVFAAAAMGLALLLGVALGFAASTSWWAGDPAGARSAAGLLLRRAVGPAVYLAARTLIALMRSVHEILWAVLFLAAMGLNDVAALCAIAIPFGGTLAKIFSEMIDEAPRDAAHALRGAGASGVQVYAFGLLTRVLPDMIAYAFYRFECALRSSAVLGFFGFETIGLYLRQSTNSLAWGEVWTYLYVLIAMIVAFEAWSGAVRRRLVEGARARLPASDSVDGLWRARPRSGLVRFSLWGFVGLIAGSWLLGGFDVADALSARRADNLAAFAAELRPHPLRGEPWDWGVALSWAGEIMQTRGYEAVAATLAISIVSILLAAAAGAALALPAARTVATAEPFVPGGRPPSAARRLGWRAVVAAARIALVLLRAVPEYVLAFLLIAVLGPTAWPAILALALHNAGILGRLGAETVENAEPRPLQALRGAGATRLQVAAVGLLPAVLPRCMLYFFYRWETCVREATVLGMLGVVSLGWWIDQARTAMHYDTMLLLILLGAAVVLAGDLVSGQVRRLVR